MSFISNIFRRKKKRQSVEMKGSTDETRPRAAKKAAPSGRFSLLYTPARDRLTALGLRIEKRLRYVISMVIMASLLLLSTSSIFSYDARYLFIPLFIVAAYICTFFALIEDIERIEWLTLFLMPIYFTLAIYMFYFLIPVRWLTRVPLLVTYCISIYALFSISNIFNVGVGKSLRLYKAAFSVNVLFQTLITFLMFSVILSYKSDFFINGSTVALVSFGLVFQMLWSVRLDLDQYNKELLRYSAIIALVMGELAALISFIPFRSSVGAMLLAACYYAIVGLTSAWIDSRLFKGVVREYVIALIVVVLVSLLTVLQW